MTRRGFLTRGAVGGLGLAASWNLGAGKAPGIVSSAPSVARLQRSYSLAMLTQSIFQEYLGESFQLHLEGGRTLEVRLVEAVMLPTSRARPPTLQREPFSLLFRAPSGTPLSQRIYKLEHPQLGSLEMFLVPVGPDSEGQRLEAIFS